MAFKSVLGWKEHLNTALYNTWQNNHKQHMTRSASPEGEGFGAFTGVWKRFPLFSFSFFSFTCQSKHLLKGKQILTPIFHTCNLMHQRHVCSNSQRRSDLENAK